MIVMASEFSTTTADWGVVQLTSQRNSRASNTSKRCQSVATSSSNGTTYLDHGRHRHQISEYLHSSTEYPHGSPVCRRSDMFHGSNHSRECRRSVKCISKNVMRRISKMPRFNLTLLSIDMLTRAWSRDITRESNHPLSLAGDLFLASRFEARPMGTGTSSSNRVRVRQGWVSSQRGINVTETIDTARC